MLLLRVVSNKNKLCLTYISNVQINLLNNGLLYNYTSKIADVDKFMHIMQ